MHLNVDTSWYLRYRSKGNPDFGDTFDQVVTIEDRPGIPVLGSYTANQIQAIANMVAFHFAMIEQGGSSLYGVLSPKCRALLALRIVTSIEGSEVAHFEIWHDQVGNAPPVDSGDGWCFPTSTRTKPPRRILSCPRRASSSLPTLPLCSIIRPTSIPLAGASTAAQLLTDTGLFNGQSQALFRTLFRLAGAADQAVRGF
jgi:hypothetical protein